MSSRTPSRFAGGLACGIATLTAKSLHLARTPVSQPLDYTLEAFSIFADIAVTCLALYLGSRWSTASLDEQIRTQVFFLKLDTPISPEEMGHAEPSSAPLAMLTATVAVGALLILFSLLATAQEARWIDATLGAALVLLGIPYGVIVPRIPLSP